MASACPFSNPSQTYGFWVSLLKSFWNIWLLRVPSQVLLKLMASDCPFSSPSQTYGFWLSLLKSFSNLWLLVEAISLRRTWEGILRSHKFEKDLRRDNQKPYVSEGLEKGHSEAISLRRTWKGTIRSHKFEKDLRRDTPFQVLLQLMASDCPFWSPSQTYGFWVSLLKSFSNLWLLIVPS
jgi:hypothetical protein